MNSSSSHPPLPVLPPLRSVPNPSSKTSKQLVKKRSQELSETQKLGNTVNRKESPSRSLYSSDSLGSSSESSISSSSSISSAREQARSPSPSSSSNYHSSTPLSPSGRARSPSHPSTKPSIQKKYRKRASIRKVRSPVIKTRRQPFENGSKDRANGTVHGYPRSVLSKIEKQTSASAAEIVGRSNATIGQALEQLAVLSSIPRRRGRPSKSVIEQRNRLEKLRDRLDTDIQRLIATAATHPSTIVSAMTTDTAITGQKSCKQPSRNTPKTISPQVRKSPERITMHEKKISNATQTITAANIESSSSSNEENEVARARKKRQSPLTSSGEQKTPKLKRLMGGTSSSLTTARLSAEEHLDVSPRQRAQKAPKTSLRKQSQETENRGKTVGQNDGNDANDVSSDEDRENEGIARDDGDAGEGEDDVIGREDEVDKNESNGEKHCSSENRDTDQKDKKIEKLQGDLDDMKDRLQKEIYRAAELEEALGLDVKAHVVSAAEVQSMKKRIAELEEEVRLSQTTMEQRDDQVREKDAALRGLLAQVKDLEARDCKECATRESNAAAEKEEKKKQRKTEAEQVEDELREEMEELKHYAKEVSARLKRVVQANRRLQQKMFLLRRGEREDQEVNDPLL